MKTNLFVAMLFLFPFFKAQSTCNYIESNPISNGYFCEGNILFFTSSVNTTVKGGISASEQIFIIPTESYGIMILPAETCVMCTEPDNGSTIGTKNGGNGGKNKNRYPDLQEPEHKQKIIIEKNPVDDILKLSLKIGSIKTIKIYNANGQEVLNKDHNGTVAELNVSKLTKGIYWAKAITNENQTYTKQFIKK